MSDFLEQAQAISILRKHNTNTTRGKKNGLFLNYGSTQWVKVNDAVAAMQEAQVVGTVAALEQSYKTLSSNSADVALEWFKHLIEMGKGDIDA